MEVSFFNNNYPLNEVKIPAVPYLPRGKAVFTPVNLREDGMPFVVPLLDAKKQRD